LWLFDAKQVGLLALKARHPDNQQRQQAEGAMTGSSPATEDEREHSNAVKPVRRHSAFGGGAPRHNLPLYRTPFVGRQHELGLVQSKLLRDDVALLTLIGPGGAGKTRLAVQAARSALENFPDGAWFVALAAIDQPELVVPAIAHVFGLQDAGDQQLEGRLRDYLRVRQVLLILDNFEHLLSAAAEVAEILADAPRVKVVVTSRALLRVSVERAVTVPTLSLPRPGDVVPLAELNQYDAIRLFIERAQAVNSEFHVGTDDAPTIAEICRRTDGLPLAIELAAARVRHLSARALLARLERPLPLLTGGARDLPPRQRTLRETMDWSYGLLEPAQQRVFRRLSVFVDGCTLEAAEVVCGGEGDLGTEMFEVLTALVDQSLLLPHAGDVPRFRLLETVREYSSEQLVASGEHAETAACHQAFYLAFAEQAEPHLRASQQVIWLDRVEAEHANLRAALAWAIAQGGSDVALRLAGCLWRFWFFRGHFTEGRQWLEAALSAGGPTSATARAKALCGAGILAHYQADYARAEALCAKSLSLYRQLNDKLGVATALDGLAVVERSRGNFDAVRARYTESLAVLREVGDAAALGHALVHFGFAVFNQGDIEFARKLVEEGHATYKATQDAWGIAFAVLCSGILAWYENDYLAAQRLVEGSLETFRALDDRRAVARSLTMLAFIALDRGNHREAAARYSEALAIFRALGDTWHIASVLGGVADLEIAEKHPLRATRLLGACVRMRELINAPVPPVFRARLERTRTRARSRLGEHEYASAWTEGRSMTTEQALAAAAASEASSTGRSTDDPAVAGHTYRASPASDLTPREIEVLRLVAAGLTNARIANELVISARTVNAHLVSIYDKLGLHTRAAATRFALEHDLT
jgi:non-specific serine/threonine protein kinase